MKNETKQTSVVANFIVRRDHWYWGLVLYGQLLQNGKSMTEETIRICTGELKELFPMMQNCNEGDEFSLKVSKFKHTGAVSIDLFCPQDEYPTWLKGIKQSFAKRPATTFILRKGVLSGGMRFAGHIIIKLFYGSEVHGGRVWLSVKKI